ncbi:hypothetical protein AMQ84_24705 [Paenibacillus riograndensis]|uniref:Uncharacterized protein n=1 Tax=Paenibacillus riograndensis TaxID=483937 RepID=A0A132TN62_9BACL|nr:hypothetical protein AMQ84_24705 [Paenibacillus riograndensis]
MPPLILERWGIPVAISPVSLFTRQGDLVLPANRGGFKTLKSFKGSVCSGKYFRVIYKMPLLVVFSTSPTEPCILPRFAIRQVILYSKITKDIYILANCRIGNSD